MILDFHAHIYPESLAPRVLENITRMRVPCYCNGTAHSLKGSMRRAGITHAVIQNIATRPGQTASILAFAEKIVQEEQGGAFPHLLSFASVHPYEEDSIAWLRRIKDMGYAGIKLHPDYQQFFIDDPRMEPFYRETARLGLITVFHAGFDESMPEVTHASTERIVNVLPLLEAGTTVLAHMGGYKMYNRTLRYLCGKNLYFDTSYNLPLLEPELAKAIFRRHGPERMLFGTDSPWADQGEAVEHFRDRFAPGFLSREDTRRVLWDNGAALLGLTAWEKQTETAG